MRQSAFLSGKWLKQLLQPGVSLRFEGKANVHWTEQHTTGSGKSRRTETRHYYAHEDYFNFDLMLFGSGKL